MTARSERLVVGVYSALLGAVRAAAEHNGHVQEITGSDSPRVKAALDDIENLCRCGVPEIEVARRLLGRLKDAVAHDGTTEGLATLLALLNNKAGTNGQDQSKNTE